MITTLDLSHKCIVQNWDALVRMNACREQVEGYIKEIAKRAYYGLKPVYRDLFNEEDGIAKPEEKGAWMQLNPAKIVKAIGNGDYFVGVGIETFRLQTIIRPTAERYCRAYVYSVCHKDKVRQAFINNMILKITNPPNEFERGDCESGYIFERRLPTLTPSEFEEPKELEAYFTRPMCVLIDWWNRNESLVSEAVVAKYKHEEIDRGFRNQNTPAATGRGTPP